MLLLLHFTPGYDVCMWIVGGCIYIEINLDRKWTNVCYMLMVDRQAWKKRANKLNMVWLYGFREYGCYINMLVLAHHQPEGMLNVERES